MGYIEPYKEGDKVLVSFTNSGNRFQFKGEIVGRTKNYFKVRSLEEVYPGEKPGRVFHIETIESRKHSANNRVVDYLEQNS